jgi:hypothetical protein
MENQERRRRRSSDPLVALHYQLSHARTLGSLDTIVVADDAGVVVAGSGSWAACEELAALAPFLADGQRRDVPPSSRIESLRSETLVRRLRLGSSDVIVCAKGARDDAARGAIDRASEGVCRILAA